MTPPTLLLSLALAAAVPDLLLPGHKPVDHRLVLQPGPATAGWTFVAAPTAGFGVEVVTVGEPFAFSAKYGTRLHALRSGETMPRGWGEFTDPGATLPTEIQSVPLMSPLARVLTTLRVVAVDGGRIELEVVGEQRWDASGARMYDGPLSALALVALAVLGSCGLAAIARRRKLLEAAR